ncbi:MAG: hypothetical protein JST04_14735 [Bdellovibrionales bacterium]|nr:hypothetical protein [Bdellovibrionales bacterium]
MDLSRPHRRHLLVAIFVAVTLLPACGQKKFLSDVLRSTVGATSGDVLVLSGGTVARTATPFPLHQIADFYSDGTFKSVLRSVSSTEFMMGMSFDFSNPDRLLYTVDTTDRVERLSLSSPTIYGNRIIDANLSGNTMRALASLSDGGTVVAESTTSIEKYDGSDPAVRVTTNFPITLTANIMKLRKISGDRFVAVTTGGTPDSPRVYTNSGVLSTTISLAATSCTTNCDPSDVLELSDGRFLVSTTNASGNAIELFSSSFAYVGQFFKDTTVLQGISALAQMGDGSIVACSTTFNTCEKIQIVGNTGVRVGSHAFIDAASVMRQPTDVLVVP